jgi:hypothetical protein
MFTTRRSTSRIDVCNYNTLLYRDYDANVNFTKNYFLSQSPPPPMTYRDLRSVMSNIRPSNVVILSEPSNPLTKSPPVLHCRKHSSKKKHKHQNIDIYRTLPRSESRCSIVGEREITNDEMMLLASSFVIDHVSPSPTNGFFHPQNLPNIQKHRIKTVNNQTRSNYTSSPSLRIEHVGPTRSTSFEIQNKDNMNRRRITSQSKSTIYPSPVTSRIRCTQLIPPESIHRTTPLIPPESMHRTTPVDVQYDEDNSQVATTVTTTITTTTTTTDSSTPSEGPIRKQLHVYMPQIISC